MYEMCFNHQLMQITNVRERSQPMKEDVTYDVFSHWLRSFPRDLALYPVCRSNPTHCHRDPASQRGNTIPCHRQGQCTRDIHCPRRRMETHTFVHQLYRLKKKSHNWRNRFSIPFTHLSFDAFICVCSCHPNVYLSSIVFWFQTVCLHYMPWDIITVTS